MSNFVACNWCPHGTRGQLPNVTVKPPPTLKAKKTAGSQQHCHLRHTCAQNLYATLEYTIGHKTFGSPPQPIPTTPAEELFRTTAHFPSSLDKPSVHAAAQQQKRVCMCSHAQHAQQGCVGDRYASCPATCGGWAIVSAEAVTVSYTAVVVHSPCHTQLLSTAPWLQMKLFEHSTLLLCN
jgi:hypothetical protein